MANQESFVDTFPVEVGWGAGTDLLLEPCFQQRLEAGMLVGIMDRCVLKLHRQQQIEFQTLACVAQ